MQNASWHWIFLINVPVGAVGLFAVRRYLPHDAASVVAPFDWVGCGLLSPCMVTFSLALENGTDSPWTALLIAVSVASALLYLPHARRRPTPLFRLALFREPNISVGLAGNLFCRIGSGAVPFLLPLLFQLQLGYSPFHSGLLLLPIAIAGMLAKRWVVPLVNRLGYDGFLQINTWIVGVSIASFAVMSPGWPLVLAILQLSGFIFRQLDAKPFGPERAQREALQARQRRWRARSEATASVNQGFVFANAVRPIETARTRTACPP